jgi:hypothetical protein
MVMLLMLMTYEYVQHCYALMEIYVTTTTHILYNFERNASSCLNDAQVLVLVVPVMVMLLVMIYQRLPRMRMATHDGDVDDGDGVVATMMSVLLVMMVQCSCVCHRVHHQYQCYRQVMHHGQTLVDDHHHHHYHYQYHYYGYVSEKVSCWSSNSDHHGYDQFDRIALIKMIEQPSRWYRQC